MDNFKLMLNGNIVIINNDVLYKSTVQDVLEDSVVINVPVGDGSYLSFEANKEIKMNYYCNDCFYTFDSKLIDRYIDNKTGIPFYRIQSPYNVRKIQRRDFVRVDFVDKINIKTKNNEDQEWIKVMLINISGGGVKFISEIKFIQDEVIDIQMTLNEQLFVLKGRIARVCDKKRGSNFVYGVEFIDIKETIREKIIQKVFSLMRNQKRSV